jgi:hypothetical protein
MCGVGWTEIGESDEYTHMIPNKTLFVSMWSMYDQHCLYLTMYM